MYNIFRISFFTAIICGIIMAILMFTNMSNFFEFINQNQNFENENPFVVLQQIYTPGFLSAMAITIIAQLTYIILGIVFIVKNTNISGGEKAIWVIGFVMFGFITAIVFMVLNSSKNLVNPITKNNTGYPPPR